MADNYLERKMEEYRAGALSKPKRHLSPTGNRRGKLTIDFPSRRVYVTGGASGIGAAIVKAFCDAGCRVAFCDKDKDKGAETAQRCGAQYHPLDVTDTSALEASLAKVRKAWGDIDIVVNNVGIGDFKPFDKANLEDFQRVIDTNVKPIWVTAKTMAMQEPDADAHRRIINISSTRHAMSEAGTEAYSASKGAVISITHALMASLAPKHITVNSISPGWIECNDYQSLREEDHLFHPSGRVGRPADIASLCIFLASPYADFINGENITVDGGVSHKMIYPE